MKTTFITNKSFLAILVAGTLTIGCTAQKTTTTASTSAKKETKDTEIKLNGKELTNQLIWFSGEFRSNYVSGVRSMKDGEHFTRLQQENGGVAVVKFNYKTYDKVGTIVNSKDLKDANGNPLRINDYTFSADEKQLLIATQQESIYRHSSKAFYYIYNIDKKELKPLSDNKKGKQRLAEFSPNGSLVAFVRNNNMYFTNLETGKEFEITQDGKTNEIIYGATDWVYEEEFSFHKGFEWNADGTKIAYYKFNESEVKEFQLTYYGSLYPDIYKFKYPKTGEDNSIVEVFVYDIALQQSGKCHLPDENDIYIPRINWSKDVSELFVTKLNRLQNKLDIIRFDCNPSGRWKMHFDGEVFYSEESKTYIDVHDNITFLKDGRFLWTSEKDGYNHLYLIDTKGKATQITKGNWDIAEVYGINEETKTIYYLSAEDGPTQRQLYSIKLDGTGKTKLSKKKGFNSADFSSSMKYFINYQSDANTPTYISLHKNDGSEIKILEANEGLKAKVKEYDFQPKEFFSFKTTEDVELNGWMIKPPNFDESKKYPVFMTFYNGPGINLVNDSWGGANLYWHQLLAQKGYLVVCVDGRGTGYRGRDFKHVTYLQLGKYETIDQIEVAKYLGGLSYVDKNRIGVQGWSYGGYMASLCMTKGADYFKAGIAVAPVTNWRYYDNIYTERFMRTPQENGDSYDDNSPINHVDKLKGSYLLVHGGGDDNVHPQNTMEMIDALVKANKQFDLFYYPNKNHGIYGGTTRMHLFTKMTNFLLENL